MAMATVPEGVSDTTAGYHTSSRVLAFESQASQDEMEALRVRLWALTEHGGTTHCNVDGITAPCASIVSASEAD